MKWNDKNTAKLTALYHKATAEEVARVLGTTKRAVYKKACALGLHKKQPHAIVLTAQQEGWLVRNYPHISTGVCATILGISLRTVNRNARRLGLSKTDTYIRESQLHAAAKAKESHIRNGTYPPKGYYSPNLRKGEPYQFKRKTAADHDIPATDKPLLGR